jgi:hypothetical protein
LGLLSEEESGCTIKTNQIDMKQEKINAYEFYLRHPSKGHQWKGILPERRRNSKRVSTETVRKWGRRLIGKGMDPSEVFFIHVTFDRATGRIIRPNRFL